jgi:Leucine-rich repeat (LRR) protein
LLATTTANNPQVVISWDVVARATAYNLYWGTTDLIPIPSDVIFEGTGISGVTSYYVHSGVTDWTVYVYVVTAVNQNGESLPSLPVTATPFPLVLGIAFADVELASCAGAIGAGAAPEITSLTCIGGGISVLSGIENLINLTTLDLSGHAISDVSPLAALTSLSTLNLNDNSIAEVSPLAALTNLTELQLRGNGISDVSPLSGLTALTILELGLGIGPLPPGPQQGNSISDVSPLATLTSLTVLNLNNNAISDVSSLAALINLENLNLAQNSVADVTAVAALTNLHTLSLQGNNISDVSPLAALAGGPLTLQLQNNIITTGVPDLVTLTSATIDLSGNVSIPCADLDTLDAAISAGIGGSLIRPASCIP